MSWINELRFLNPTKLKLVDKEDGFCSSLTIVGTNLYMLNEMIPYWWEVRILKLANKEAFILQPTNQYPFFDSDNEILTLNKINIERLLTHLRIYYIITRHGEEI